MNSPPPNFVHGEPEWIGEKIFSKETRGGTRASKKKIKRATFPAVRIGGDEFHVGDVLLLQSGDDDMPYIGQVLHFYVSIAQL